MYDTSFYYVNLCLVFFYLYTGQNRIEITCLNIGFSDNMRASHRLRYLLKQNTKVSLTKNWMDFTPHSNQSLCHTITLKKGTITTNTVKGVHS